jgi:hypothetical protein
MKQIIFFFFIQTIILVSWFNLPSSLPPILYGKVNYMLFGFCKAGYYQFLNVGFLIALFVEERKRFLTMLSFAKNRMDWVSALMILFYISLIVVFLVPLSPSFLYKGPIVLITGLLAFFSMIFPKDTFSNPKGFKENEFNFQLLGKWWKKLPVIGPLLGIFIVGLQGSGKTKSVVEPILAQMIEKGYSGIVYDFKFETSLDKDYSLTHLVYKCLHEFKDRNKSRFFSINFQDVKTSSRFNPIDPSFIQDRKTLSDYIETFLSNLNPQEAQKRDFWFQNTFLLLMSIISFLSNNYPTYCTLPHAFLIGMQDFKNLLPALKSDRESSLYVSACEDAFKKAPEQFTGVITSFKTLLVKLLDKDICWVLGASEVPVIVNDAQNPVIICLGNTATQTSFTSPPLVVIASVLLSKMYARGRNKSFLMIDELPMFILPNLAQVPAIAREYGISTVVALQDLTQLREMYSNLKADTIQNIFSNYFLGRSSPDGGEYIKNFMGKIEKEVTSTSKSNNKTSVTTSQKEVPLITQQEAMSLEAGEFVGKVVHPSGGFFRMKLKTLESYFKHFKLKDFEPLPILRQEVDVEENFRKIEKEVTQILEPFKSKSA